MSPSSADACAALVATLAASLVMLAGCAPAPAPGEAPNATAIASEWHEFEGSWTAAGTRQTLRLGTERQASIASLRGSLLLSGPARPSLGFLAETIVLGDSAGGLTGRAVWTDDHGDQVFSELRGEGTRTGNRITGSVFGGTGRYAGMVGEYQFSWKFVLDSEGGAVQVQSTGLKGRVRVPLPAAPGTPARGASQP